MKRIEHFHRKLSVKRKCELFKVARSRVYYCKKSVPDDDIRLMNEMREIYTQYPFYGYRRIHATLRRKGYMHNHKRTERLMRIAGLQAIYPHKKTTVRNNAHAIFPYLLRNLKIERPNQIWSVDITYIKIRSGFVYLVCLIDVYSRKIMGWAVSISLDVDVCLRALEDALYRYVPEIINSDQGCQFTSHKWVDKLKYEKISISMDGKGRWADNIYIERFWRSIKYEAVYLQSFETVKQACVGLAHYIEFYNSIRPHQALGYKTPDQIFEEWFSVDKGYQRGLTPAIDKLENIMVQKSTIGGNIIFS